jgi:ribosome-associated toxin RatA of RatAB toxin-antitoxin module
MLVLVLASSLSMTAAIAPVFAVDSSKTLSTPVHEVQFDNKPYQVSKVLVKAKPDQVWQVLTNYNDAPAIFPNLKKCQVVADHGTTKIVHYQIRPTGVLASFQYDLELHEIGHSRVEWKRVSGDFKEVTGYWQLESAECGQSTVVTYANHVNGGLFMPQALIKHQSKIDVPVIMACLRGRAESTQIASRVQRSNPE